jgi:hypothetical protein
LPVERAEQRGLDQRRQVGRRRQRHRSPRHRGQRRQRAEHDHYGSGHCCIGDTGSGRLESVTGAHSSSVAIAVALTLPVAFALAFAVAVSFADAGAVALTITDAVPDAHAVVQLCHFAFGPIGGCRGDGCHGRGHGGRRLRLDRGE